MNAWVESIRLAGLLLRRLREFNERGVRAFFTRGGCRKFDVSNWRFDGKAIKCLRTWYIRALVSVASVLHPLVKAYGGVKYVESIVEEVDVTRVDVRENLLSDLARLIYETALSRVKDEALGDANDEFIISRVVNAGIGDLTAQISRVEELMRKCRDGKVVLEGEEIDCQELWLYNAELRQVLSELQRLARKYNVSIEPSRLPWWLLED